DMEVWANPALEWQRDPGSPWAIHQARFPGEDKVVILNKPRFNDLEVVCFNSADPEAANARFVIKDGKAWISTQGLIGKPVEIGNTPIQRATIRFSKHQVARFPN